MPHVAVIAAKKITLSKECETLYKKLTYCVVQTWALCRQLYKDYQLQTVSNPESLKIIKAEA